MRVVYVHADFFKLIQRHSAEEIGRLFHALMADIDGSERPVLPASLEIVKKLIDKRNLMFAKETDNEVFMRMNQAKQTKTTQTTKNKQNKQNKQNTPRTNYLGGA